MIPGLNNNFGIKTFLIQNKIEYLLLIIDIWPWNMDSPLSDDPNNEQYDLHAFINDQVKIKISFLFNKISVCRIHYYLLML
jgi:hypothetical protein